MADTREPKRNRPIQDLREWLERVAAIGELVEVDQPVERDEEMSAIGYLLAKQKPSPAVVFNKTAGFEKSSVGTWHLWTGLGPSGRRSAVTLEEDADTPTVELIRRTKDKLKRRTPPLEVAAKEAAFFQNTLTGDKIDLEKLPIPKHWPRDGGRYACTADCVITRDPETGYLNIGTYRMMIQGKNTCGLYLSPGKDARLHIMKAWEQGRSLGTAEVDVIIWGTSPQVGAQGADMGRMAALDAGFDIRASGMTLDRFCGSGITTVNLAAAQIMSGMEDLVIAGGTEMMSYTASIADPKTPPMMDRGNLHLRKLHPQSQQGVCADFVAAIEGIDRRAVDELALMSQQRAGVAMKEGRFARSVVPGYNLDGTLALDRDEFPRPDTTMETLAGLKPVFGAVADIVVD